MVCEGTLGVQYLTQACLLEGGGDYLRTFFSLRSERSQCFMTGSKMETLVEAESSKQGRHLSRAADA